MRFSHFEDLLCQPLTSITPHLYTLLQLPPPSPRHGVLGLKNHSSTHAHNTETKYYSFSTKEAMSAYLHSFFLETLFSSPLISIHTLLFYFSLLLSEPKVTEHLALKYGCWSKNSENSWVLNGICLLIPVVYWFIL